MLVDKQSSENDEREAENDSEAETCEEKLKYPKSVFYIISNEFCERFCFYGMRTILSFYLSWKLHYSDDTATIIYHTFSMLLYFFPLFGAMLADSYLGKFRTIFYLSIVYAAGQLLLSVSAVPTLGIPMREMSLLGLLLIAIGTGGIKPCVAAFGGDQFVLPQQERHLATFFSLFYFAINSGSLISSYLTPELRTGVECFGDRDCYSLAFFVPTVLMVVSIVIFLAGRPLYKVKKPEGNVVLHVVKCISHAIYNKTSAKEKRDHWLDHADDKYDGKVIEDIKSALGVLTLFVPLPIFWALFDQQSSRWTFQAAKMDGKIGSYLLKPDQIQVVNPLFIIIFIPLFETCIYPIMAKIKLINTPLKKLTTGGILAAVAFIISGIVELEVQKTYPVLPSQGIGQLRIFNPQNCSIYGRVDNESISIEPYEMWAKTDIRVTNFTEIDYSVHFDNCNGETIIQSGKIVVQEEKSVSYAFFYNNVPYDYPDSVSKRDDGTPLFRALVHNDNFPDRNNSIHLVFEEKKVTKEFHISGMVFGTQLEPVTPATYDIKLNDKVVATYEFKLGGVYTILIHINGDQVKVHPIIVSQPNTMHVLWQIPQYVVITMGEVMFSVTGLEFAFTQAPANMKSLLQAGWLLTVAVGNLIVVFIAKMKFFDKQSSEFFLFAGLMIANMIVFAIMTLFYKYKEVPETESIGMELQLEENGGNINPTFRTFDEKL